MKTTKSPLLTEDLIKALPAPHPDGQILFWDREIVGLGVLCIGSTSVKSFVAQHKNRRLVLERCAYMSLEQARSAALDAIKAIRRGEDPKVVTKPAPSRDGSRLRAVFDEYLEVGRAGALRQNSRRFYTSLFEQHFKDWANKPVGSITAAMVVEKHAAIVAKVKRSKHGTTGGASGNGAMRLLSALFRHVRRKDPDAKLIDVRAVMRGGWAKEVRRTHHVPAASLPTFYSALRTLPRPMRRACVELLLLLGLRLREATELKWSEVDFANNMIVLPPSRTKAGRAFRCPLSSRAVELLRGLSGMKRARVDYVFHSRLNGPIADLSREFDLLSEAIGKRVSAHDLRRGYASLAHSAVLDLLTIRRLLNHSEAGSVTSGYIIRSDTELSAAHEKISHYILAACKADTLPRRKIARHTIRETVAA